MRKGLCSLAQFFVFHLQRLVQHGWNLQIHRSSLWQLNASKFKEGAVELAAEVREKIRNA